MNTAPELEELLGVIRSGRLDERRHAYSAVAARAEVGLPEADEVRLLEWAAQPLPPIDGYDVASVLIAVVAMAPRTSHVEVVQRIYSRLPSRSARTHALDLLNGLAARAAAEAYVALLEDYDPAHSLDTLGLDGLHESPRHAGVFFPLLFRWAEIPRFRRDILELTLEYAQAGMLEPGRLAMQAESWLLDLADVSSQVRAAAGLRGEQWRWRDDYYGVRASARTLIALIGYLPPSVAEAPLREALQLPDPALRLEALEALGKIGDPFALLDASRTAVLLAGLGCDLETRCRLHRWLEARGEGERMPEPLCEETAVAAGALAERLVSHPELGAVPDELELVVTLVPGIAEGLRYHLFRFRYHAGHPAAPFEWMAGLVGPFEFEVDTEVGTEVAVAIDIEVDGEGAGEGEAASFPPQIVPDCVATALEPWSAHTPAEHLRRLRSS